MRPHVIIGADHECTQRIHQGEVAISPIAGAKEIPDDRVELAVLKLLAEKLDELLFLVRSDIVQLVNRLRLLQAGIVLLVVSEARVVEDHHFDAVAIGPEVLIIFLDGLGDISQPVGWNHKYNGDGVHW